MVTPASTAVVSARRMASRSCSEFVITSTDDLSVRSDISLASGVTYFQARSALNSHLAGNPADAGNLQIVTLYEAAA